MNFVELWKDEFNDGIQSLDTVGVGTISEGGGVLQITNDGLNAEWYDGAGNAPIAYIPFLYENGAAFRYETRITSFTGSGDARKTCGVTMFTEDRLNWIQFHFNEYDDKLLVQRGLSGAGSTLYTHSAITHPNTTPLRLRVIWDNDSNVASFLYSPDDGTTYTRIYTTSLGFNPQYFGLFGREYYYTNPSFTIQFDYLQISDGYEIFEPDVAVGLTESVEFLDQPGTTPDIHTYPQILPGEMTIESSGGFTDDHDFLDQPSTTPDKHTYPELSPGEMVQRPSGAMLDAAEFTDQPGITPAHHTYPQITMGHRDFAHYGGMSDFASVDTAENITFVGEIVDADGYDQLGGFGVTDVLHIDITQESFGDPETLNHWGAAYNGVFYANGVECFSEGYDFGTLAGGFKTSAWRFSGLDPLGLEDGTTVFALVGDDQLRIQGTWPYWTAPGGAVNSHLKWYIDGDFDIQVDYSNYVVNALGGNAESRLAVFYFNQNGLQQFYINRDANGTYRTARTLNGGYASLGTVATSDTSGKLRITRSSGVLTAYKWNGASWDQVGSTLNDSRLYGALIVGMGCSGDANANTDITFGNFTINSGTVINTAGWLDESAGANRGIKDTMPTNLAIACTKDSVDLLDLDTNKMWMRFVKSGNNALHYYSSVNQRPWRLAWSNGLLMIAHGSLPAESPEGGAIWVDFTYDYIRIHREAVSTVCGGIVADGTSPSGSIIYRNDNLSYTGDYDIWAIQDYRVYDVDVWHVDGYEFRAIATADGLSAFRELRWYDVDSNGLNNSISAETNPMFWCKFNPYDGYLFYMDNDNLYSAIRGGFGTGIGWEGYMDGGTFTSDFTKVLPPMSHTDQHHGVFLDNYVLVPSRDGVYVCDWPNGSWELLYGKPGSGATHEILPSHANVSAITLKDDQYLFCCLDGAVIPFNAVRENQGVQIVVIDMNTDSVWGKSKIYKNWAHSAVRLGA